mgnify:CR=1 FL=1|jgi:hypothetical protein
MQSKSLARTLDALKDVDGTIGSFVLDGDGELVFADLPDELLEGARKVGPRLARLRDALALSEGDVSACNLRFASSKLSLAPTAGGILAVMAAANVNDSALRTAVNLARRRITADDLATGPVEVTPPPPAIDLNQTLISSAPLPLAENILSEQPKSSGAGAPESMGRAGPPRKERAVFFRGKRIN